MISRTATDVDPPSTTDTQALAFDLRRRIDGEVRFDPGSRHLYATDASNFRQIPTGVVVPRSRDDIVTAATVCRDHGVPITHRGGGTSLAGQACNSGVIIDTSKYVRSIVDIDRDAGTATVEPGLVLDTLRRELAVDDLTWGPAPSTHNRCTIGGMLGNDSCGAEAFAYGRAADNVEALDVLLYDGTRLTVGPMDDAEVDRRIAAGGREGELYAGLRRLRDRYGDLIRERTPRIPRAVSGYNLQALLPEEGFNVARALVGSEGTCATILQATLALHHRPRHRALVVVGYEDVFTAADAVADLRHIDGLHKLEGMDHHLLRNMREKHMHVDAVDYLPEGDGWLLCELGGDSPGQAEEHARALEAQVDGDAVATVLYTDPDPIASVWKARESGLGATAHFGGSDHWPGWEDSAVHPDRVGDYLRDLTALFDDHGYDASVYGHFGDGCVHCRIDFELTDATGIDRYRRFLEEAADLVAGYGGSLSGEHGDGQQRGALLERMFGPEVVQAMREFEVLWDPDGRMNPGKVVDARPVDADLRLGADYAPWQPDTVFAYTDDGFDFAAAQLRCVGVGECRRDDGHGTMCPSYRVTREEMHSTRGRARLLFEMLQPDSELDGWRDPHVHEALELCLSCKGCVTDCPVDVDMATYKAEFYHHHYAGRLHPRVHYALGLIDVWARIGTRLPGVANLALSAPGISGLLKRAAGVAPDRPAPAFAGHTFQRWFADHRPAHPDGPPVVLFPDTFVDSFEPEVGKATVEVLEAAGFRVEVPDRYVCCGRPLYDYGMLDLADRYLARLTDTFTDAVAADVPVVVMEPSCLAVFRDELVQMRPDDGAAQRLAERTFTLGEFLAEHGSDLPPLDVKALVQQHCHHEAVVGLEADQQVYDRMGLDWEELDAGCCGLAGSFGYEDGDPYDVSVAVAEERLLPAVRRADPGTLLIADGFSCRSQIQQLQGSRRALHLAQVIQLAHRDTDGGGRPIEAAAPATDPPTRPPTAALTALGVGAVAAAATLWRRTR